MVRVKALDGPYWRMHTTRWAVDDGRQFNSRVVESVRASGNVTCNTDGPWVVFPDAYLSFAGNHAVINPNPTHIVRAQREVVQQEVDDGS